MTCDAAPTQIEGELDDGRFFYFRARHLTMRLALSHLSVPHAAGGGDRELCFELHGAGEDRHLLSFVPDEHAQPLLAFMLSLHENIENWERRSRENSLGHRLRNQEGTAP